METASAPEPHRIRDWGLRQTYLECVDLDEAVEVASKNPGAGFGILELMRIEPA